MSASASPAPVEPELDSSGHERLHDEVIFQGRESDLDRLQARGYSVIERHALQSGRGAIARIRVRDGESIEHALESLGRLAPDAQLSPNYLFRPSGSAEYVPSNARAFEGRTVAHGQVALIDTGAETKLSELEDAVTGVQSFTGAYMPRAHGTRVALVAARAGVKVLVVDVFQLDASGSPVATAETITRALDWLIARNAPVINISISGPDTKILSEMIARAVARGIVIVAAAGNEGPGAAPVYPAAYKGVLAVTAVDSSGRIYRRANRGAYISFAAFGVGVPGAAPATGDASGTSFAAPLVAAKVAQHYSAPSRRLAEVMIDRLRREAIDRGPRGRDPMFGWGEIR